LNIALLFRALFNIRHSFLNSRIGNYTFDQMYLQVDQVDSTTDRGRMAHP
jgi:hypothetical protein